MVVNWPVCMKRVRRPTLRRLGTLKRPASAARPVTAWRPLSSAMGRRPMLRKPLPLKRGGTWQALQWAPGELKLFQPWIWLGVIAVAFPAMNASQGVWFATSVRS